MEAKNTTITLTPADRAAIAKAAPAIAIRIDTAYAKGAEYIAQFSGLDPEAAEMVARWYVHKKYARIDAVNGTYHVKYGSLYDAETIMRAVELIADGAK